MKAAVRSKYGPPKVLSIKEVEIPTPKDHEVLIRIHATTVNRTDWGILRGKPLLTRAFTGLLKPRSAITGSDFAGQIEAVGLNVKSFKVGDKVMGFIGMMMGVGSHAQYLTFPEDNGINTLPANLTYEEAVACVEGTFYGLTGINVLNPKAGQKALVNGATGAIGSSIVQILKSRGVYVTATCRGEHIELVKSLGADKIIDYKTEDFTKDKEQYDFIFDAVGKSTFAKCKPLLKKNGVYLPTDGFRNVFLALVTRMFSGKKVLFPMPQNINAGLSSIKGLIEMGNLKPVIDRKYPLDKIAEAYTYVSGGQKVGNVIITMDA